MVIIPLPHRHQVKEGEGRITIFITTITIIMMMVMFIIMLIVTSRLKIGRGREDAGSCRLLMRGQLGGSGHLTIQCNVQSYRCDIAVHCAVASIHALHCQQVFSCEQHISTKHRVVHTVPLTAVHQYSARGKGVGAMCTLCLNASQVYIFCQE